MVISSAGYRHLVSRAPATIQAGRAQYLTAQEAATTHAARKSAQLFAQQAEKAFAASAQTGMIDLDTSLNADGDSPATTRNLLARYLVIREGEEFEFSAHATCLLFYVIKGSGRSFQEDEVIQWGSGDVFVFPGGEPILNEAPATDAVLFVVTDEPFVSMTGCSVPSRENARCKSTHYAAKTIQAKLEDMVEQRERELAARKATAELKEMAEDKDTVEHSDLAEHSDSVEGETIAAGAEPEILIFTSSEFENVGGVAPTLSAAIEMLDGGAQTQPHRHDVDTISLCLKSAGAYSMVETDRIEWKRNTVILTPAGASHCLHNVGDSRIFSFFVQDCGPRPVRTWQSDQRNQAE